MRLTDKRAWEEIAVVSPTDGKTEVRAGYVAHGVGGRYRISPVYVDIDGYKHFQGYEVYFVLDDTAPHTVKSDLWEHLNKGDGPISLTASRRLCQEHLEGRK